MNPERSTPQTYVFKLECAAGHPYATIEITADELGKARKKLIKNYISGATCYSPNCRQSIQISTDGNPLPSKP